MGFSINTKKSDYSNEYLTVKTAAMLSGYNQQYLRRLLRENRFESKRIGQLWLIDRHSFMNYIDMVNRSKDKRFGPQ